MMSPYEEAPMKNKKSKFLGYYLEAEQKSQGIPEVKRKTP